MNADGEVTDRTTLYKKLALIMGEVNRVEKSGQNQKQNYKFASESDIADMVRGLMAKNNVALLVDMQEVDSVEISSQSGTKGVHYRIWFEFTFACGDTGATISRRWMGEAQDWQDKGINKASSFAEKYFLIKTFVMSTGDIRDDPDGESGEAVAERKGQNGKRTQQPEQSAPPKPPGTPSQDWVKHDDAWNRLVKRAMDLWEGITLPHARNRVMAALHITGGWDKRATFQGTPEQALAMVTAYVPSEDVDLDAETAAELGGELASQDPLFPPTHRAESDAAKK